MGQPCRTLTTDRRTQSHSQRIVLLNDADAQYDY
jgi:hypothetical protein